MKGGRDSHTTRRGANTQLAKVYAFDVRGHRSATRFIRPEKTQHMAFCESLTRCLDS